MHFTLKITYRSNQLFQVRGKMLDQSARSLKLTHLYPGIKYRICVLALGHWISSRRRATAQSRLSYKKASVENITDAPKDGFRVFQENILPILVDSTTSKCTEVRFPKSTFLIVIEHEKFSWKNRVCHAKHGKIFF